MTIAEGEIGAVKVAVVRDAPSPAAAWRVRSAATAAWRQNGRVNAVAVIVQAIKVDKIRVGRLIVVARSRPCPATVGDGDSV